MDDELTLKRLRNAYKLGFNHGQRDKSIEQLYYDPDVVRNARLLAWQKHDRTQLKLTKDGNGVICPDEWPPGTKEDDEVERHVLEQFADAHTRYDGEPDDDLWK